MVSIRIPVLLVFIASLVLAGYLGFANVHFGHDKLIHFITFFILTIEFYFTFDTKHKSLKTLRSITLIVCTIGGGIGSEFIQSLVNENRVFDPIDIAFNILGSLLAVGLSSWYQTYLIKRAKEVKRNNRYTQIGQTITNEELVGDTEDEGYVSIQMHDTGNVDEQSNRKI
ncbi:uncharacterized protein RJT21DRAFT_123413 [Scheffersomyces amazonensis]|uniref:uncharacterized protein n=1 Tax=Scheffersomyces amazonensis TaxID=1078765 RepID=UPI00315D81C9